MANVNIPVPKQLRLHEGNVAESWRKFKSAWTNYETAVDFVSKQSAVRVAALLSVIGEDAVAVYDTFEWAATDDKNKIDEVLARFEYYCIPRKNILFETYRFGCRRQEEGETIDQYATALRILAANCEFKDQERRLQDQVVVGLRENNVRERLLREPFKDLKSLIAVVRAHEAAGNQSRAMQEKGSNEEAHSLQSQQTTYRHKEKQNSGADFRPQTNVSIISCKFCGLQHERRKEACPAWGKQCKKCSKLNHTESCCYKKSKTNAVEEIEMLTLFAVEAEKPKKKTKTLIIRDSRKQITFQIDTGAACNVIPLKEYVRVTGDRNLRNVEPKKVNLKAYGGHIWPAVGACNIEVVYKGRVHTIYAIIARMDANPLLSLKSCEELGIVKVLDCDQEPTDQVTVATGLTEYDIIQRFPDVFDGLGKLKGQYHIHTDEKVKPVVHAPRRLPVAVREPVKQKLTQMVKEGVLARVTEPTKWVSSLLVKKEPNKLRICLDPKDLNRAIQREHFRLPCIEEVATRLSDAKVFTVLDAKDGFWQVELDQESSLLTTFNTPFGRYRWTRMPFGISSAPEVWQRRMYDFAEDLEGVEVIADDFLIVGRGDTDEEADKDHDKNLLAILRKSRKENLKLNIKKMRLKLKELTFIGQILTVDGMKVDPRKVEAVMKMPIPSDAKAIRRLLGMVQYLSKFLPKLSEVTEPLRRLTDEGAVWDWTVVHQESLDRVKHLVTTTPVLAYYDSRKEVLIQADSSDTGIGAVLLQQGKPVIFSSRAMTPTEQRYAQIEKELLAIVHACDKFDQYIYGRPCIGVETDHKPLEIIFNKPITSAPKRIQRMLLFLQKYDLQVRYKKGAELYIADTLSRAYLPNTERCETPDVMGVEEKKVVKDLHGMSTTRYVNNSKQRIEELRAGTKIDNLLQQVGKLVKDGWPDDRSKVPLDIRPYYQIRDELTCEDDLLFKGVRIIIPRLMRPGVMKRLHSSHIGIENTLRLAREHVYWPGMNRELKDYISVCDLCNSMRREQSKEPMMSHDIPTRPWQTVSTDMFQLNGKNYIVLVDHFSSFFEYDRLEDTDSQSVIEFLGVQFARYGVPEKVISDNGTPYASRLFLQFAVEWEFDHVMSSPYHPKSNGKAESAVRVCKTLMKKATQGRGDVRKYMLDWRNTPTDQTGLSPAQRMHGRRTRSLIPGRDDLLIPQQHFNVEEDLSQGRRKEKQYYDKGTKGLPVLKIADRVWIKEPGQKQWSQGTVIKQERQRSFIVKTGKGEYRRNRRAILQTKPRPTEE